MKLLGPESVRIAETGMRLVMRRRLTTCLICPGGHAFDRAVLADFRANRFQLLSVSAAPTQVCKLFLQRDVGAQRG